MAEPRAPFADRGGVWPVPYTRTERVWITEQAKADRRTIPAVWLWRLLTDEDPVTGTSPDGVLFEAPKVTRRYASPIAVHLFLDWGGEAKKAGPGGVQTVGTAKIGWSRAEARRVGALLKTRDDAEGLVDDKERQDFLFIPRPQDVVRQRGRYYEVKQLSPEYVGDTSIPIVWRGTSVMAADDLSSPGYPWLPQAPSLHPPLPEVLPWHTSA